MRQFAGVDFEEDGPIDDALISLLERGESAPFDAPVRMYLKEIGTVPVLDADQESALVQAVERGDKDARHRLTENSLRRVARIGSKYLGRGIPLLELIRDGNMGLIRAVATSRDRTCPGFKDYAAWGIWRAIMERMAEPRKGGRQPGTARVQRLPRVLLVDEEGGAALLARYAADRSYGGSTRHRSVEGAKAQAGFDYGQALGHWNAIPNEIADPVAFALLQLEGKKAQ